MEKLLLYRLGIFLLSFTLFFILQFIIPRRKFIKNRWKYILTNIIISGLNSVVIMLLIFIPIKAAIIAQSNNIGILYKLGIPYYIQVIASIVMLDIIIYFQHRIFHNVNFLWRFHSVHHIDPMLDTSSGFRFHPIEIVLSNFIKIGAVFIIGVPVIAIVIFEIILNTTAMFNHSNFRVHFTLEKVLRYILVTPDLHLIHHSVEKSEMNSNFGFSVIWWDKLFGSYISTPKGEYQSMPLGIKDMPSEKLILFPGMLIYPFKQ